MRNRSQAKVKREPDKAIWKNLTAEAANRFAVKSEKVYDHKTGKSMDENTQERGVCEWKKDATR